MDGRFLDPTTGHLTLAGTWAVTPRTTPDEVLAHLAGPAGHVVEVDDLGHGGQLCRVRNVSCAGTYFHVAFRFDRGHLASLEFLVSDAPRAQGGWSDWSEPQERARERAHEAWLTGQVGTARTFPWGSVSSLFDPRSASAFILLRYATT